MTDDHLLKALGEAARKGVPHDPRWNALAAGSLSEADQAALRAEAQSSAEGRAAYEAYRPIDAAARERAVDRILAQMEGGGPAPAKKVAARRRTGAWSTVASLGVLAAALVLLLFLWQRTAPYGPLPGYELAAAGDMDSRTDPPHPGAIAHLGVGSRAEITMRPTAAVQGPVSVRCFLAQDGRVRDWAPPVEVAGSGAVHLEGERARLFPGVPAGRWEMIFAVGRPGTLPSGAGAVEAALRSGGGNDAAFRLLRGGVVLEGEAP